MTTVSTSGGGAESGCETNTRRDERVTRELRESGWTLGRVCESTILTDLSAAGADVERALSGGQGAD